MEPKTILCYGDSNTWGYDPVNACRFPRDVRWPGVLQTELGEDYVVIEEGLCGRTTVWEDPVEQYKNGREQLVPILLSHVPLDLVVIMLGTNDLKSRFGVSAMEIARSAASLVQLVRNCETGWSGDVPEVLLVCPPPFGPMEGTPFAELFAGGEEKSRGLATHFAQVAEELSCSLLDAGQVVVGSPADGIHFEAGEHAKLGMAVARRVLEMLAP